MAEATRKDSDQRFGHNGTDERRAPDDVTDLPKQSWKGVFKRALREFSEDNVTDWAAALTYYGVLSIFPMLLALISLLGLFGSSATQPLLDNIASIAPGPAKDIVTQAIQNLQKSQGAAGVLFFVGLAAALWSASGYVGAFMRASNDIWDVEEGRPAWKTIPLRLGVTALLLVLLTISALAVVLTGPLAKTIGDIVGLGSTAVTVWDIAKWPVLILLVSFMIALLYYAAPNVKHPKFQWVSPGSIMAVVLWIAASALFAFYVANFSSYNKTYGALGGVIVFLTWLWITNNVILLGAEFNAELERGRQIQGGLRPHDKEPFLEPRDTRKMKHHD
ncbi:MAG: rane protein [Solirubrobacteraceae bacterium]|jgi:membrane protein|nr:rane protein [Solirubrobacteraceae bacterium]